MWVKFFVASIFFESVLAFRNNLDTGTPSLYQAPYHVSLQKMHWPLGSSTNMTNYKRQSQHFCSGGLIRLNVALTAAHCLRFPKELIVVKAGLLFINKVNTKMQTSTVLDYITHPDYDFNMTSSPFDLGIIVLREPFQHTSAVSFLPMATECFDDSGLVTVSGWEWQETTTSYGAGAALALHSTEMSLISVEMCFLELVINSDLDELSELQMCTDSTLGFGDPCQSDNGGLAVQNGEIVGIKSFNCNDCNWKTCPSVYTRICLLYEFVLEYFDNFNERQRLL